MSSTTASRLSREMVANLVVRFCSQEIEEATSKRQSLVKDRIRLSDENDAELKGTLLHSNGLEVQQCDEIIAAHKLISQLYSGNTDFFPEGKILGVKSDEGDELWLLTPNLHGIDKQGLQSFIEKETGEVVFLVSVGCGMMEQLVNQCGTEFQVGNRFSYKEKRSPLVTRPIEQNFEIAEIYR